VRRAYFSLGSNQGDRAAFLNAAVRSVSRDDAHRESRVYQTEPVGGVAQDDFWNMVLEVTTSASPPDLLARIRDAESAAQRTRDVHWGPRTLDVDLLWVDDVTWSDAELTVPHPQMYQRRFVLVPLRELREDLVSDEALALADGRVRLLGTLDTLH
jgi:2-amino-4-hydroxy-6-hydroxymethyldihydropteridine diphosphokinase